MAQSLQRDQSIDQLARQTDVVIIGGGIAGISLALTLPATAAVTLITKNALGESNTRYAQGGLAAAVGMRDTAASHLADTLSAGAGHCDPLAVQTLVNGADAAIDQLLAAGTRFDPAHANADEESTALIAGQALALGHEAAHSHHRVLHAHGDATGAEIERALVATLRTRTNVTVLENTFATALMREGDRCTGVRIVTPEGQHTTITARAVVLANGGAGRLWRRTSNPAGATADGLALAWRAGAVLTDLEFAQFHPTVLVPPDPGMPTFLISEAVRGEGAYLRNHAGERFMLSYPHAELEARDVVARAILQELLREGKDHVWLDLSHLDPEIVRGRFPTIAATCAQIGIDITRDPIPVAPAAHYFMGGVAVDRDARTTVARLWAIGEVACTGVHGANRLASNSLLEGIVFGRRAAVDIATMLGDEAATTWSDVPPFNGETLALDAAIYPAAISDSSIQPLIQTIMWERAGLYRTATEMTLAAAQLAELSKRAIPERDTITPYENANISEYESANMLAVAQLIVAAAQARHESRGGHARSDFPEAVPALAGFHIFVKATPEQRGSAQHAEVIAEQTTQASANALGDTTHEANQPTGTTRGVTR